MLILVLLVSNETYLTNFSKDKKLWPIYMSVGNILSSIQNQVIVHAWIPITLLLTGLNRVKEIKRFSEKDQEMDALQVMHHILRNILQPFGVMYKVCEVTAKT